MFEVKNEVPQWQRVYDLIVAAEIDQVISYDEFDAALGLNFRAYSRPGLDKATKALEHNNRRTVEVVRNKGYRVVRAEEHERLARKHQLKGLRQTKRSMRKVRSADRSQLSSTDGQRLDAMEVHYGQLAAAQRRNATRIEEVDSARKADKRDTSEELAMLASQLERLQARIEKRDRSAT